MELEKKPHEICAQNELQDLSHYIQYRSEQRDEQSGGDAVWMD